LVDLAFLRASLFSAKCAPSSVAWGNAPGKSGHLQPISAESAIHSGTICVGINSEAVLETRFQRLLMIRCDSNPGALPQAEMKTHRWR
jgi:hypothetical protein